MPFGGIYPSLQNSLENKYGTRGGVFKATVPEPVTNPTPTGGGYYDPSQAIFSNALAKINDIYSKIDKYQPASFDEALAKQSVTQSEDQYYKSKISDFLKGVDLQRSQSKESETTLLNQLTAGKDRYLKSEAQQYDIAKNDALNNVVGTGRQLSGFGQRALGQQAAVRNTNLQNYLAGVNEQNQNIQQNYNQDLARTNLQQELTLGANYDPNNLANLGGEYGRARSLAIEQGVANRKNEFTSEEQLRQDQYKQSLQNQIGATARNAILKAPSLAQYLGGYL